MKLVNLLNDNVKRIFFLFFLHIATISMFSQGVFEEDFSQFTPTTQFNAETEFLLHNKIWKFSYVDRQYSSAKLTQCVVLRHSTSGNNALGYLITPAMKAPKKISFNARLQYTSTRDNSVEVLISENGKSFVSVGSILIKRSTSDNRTYMPFSPYSIDINSISDNVKIKILRNPSPPETSDINIIIDNIGVTLGDPTKCLLDSKLPALQDICVEGQSVKLDASVTATGAITYNWSTGETTPSILTSKPGLYSVVITNSCDESITRQVLVRSLKEAGIYGKDGNLNQSENVCAGASVQLNADKGNALSYQWMPVDYLSNSNIANPIASPVSSTTYNVAIKTTGGCLVNKAVFVNVSTPFDLNSNNGDIYDCMGKTVPLSVSGADYYRWYPTDGLSCYDCPNPEHTISGDKTYTVTGVKNGCTASKAINIVAVPDKISYEYSKNGCTLSFSAIENIAFSNYSWTFGDGTTGVGKTLQHTYAMHGTYYVCLKATNTCGAIVSHCISITIKSDECSCQLQNCQ